MPPPRAEPSRLSRRLTPAWPEPEAMLDPIPAGGHSRLGARDATAVAGAAEAPEAPPPGAAPPPDVVSVPEEPLPEDAPLPDVVSVPEEPLPEDAPPPDVVPVLEALLPDDAPRRGIVPVPEELLSDDAPLADVVPVSEEPWPGDGLLSEVDIVLGEPWPEERELSGAAGAREAGVPATGVAPLPAAGRSCSSGPRPAASWVTPPSAFLAIATSPATAAPRVS